ncbi:MAG: hypothetical protein ABW061_03730 [Polyangiaceae bacterium]
MKRLLDEQGLQGDDAQLAELLRSAAPFEIDPFRKRRILVRIERGSTKSHWRFWLRPAVALTLLISGSAAAAIGHHYAPPGTGFFGLSGAPSATTNSARRAPSASPAAHVATAATGVAPTGVAPTGVAPDVAVDPGPAPAPSVAPAASGTKAGARARPESSEDASNVVEAIQALRAGRDPARAQVLLDDYLKSHPRGALSGDALALSIEAASARNDPRAADYARRYLAMYPKGKYRDLAKRALEKQH